MDEGDYLEAISSTAEARGIIREANTIIQPD
jgi:hypothetical protein